jgi:hypothetical protein
MGWRARLRGGITYRMDAAQSSADSEPPSLATAIGSRRIWAGRCPDHCQKTGRRVPMMSSREEPREGPWCCGLRHPCGCRDPHCPPLAADACGWQVWVGFAFPGRPQPPWTSPTWRSDASPLGSPRQEREGSQARYRSCISRSTPRDVCGDIIGKALCMAGADRSNQSGRLRWQALRREPSGFLVKNAALEPGQKLQCQLENPSKTNTSNPLVVNSTDNCPRSRGRAAKVVRETDLGRPNPAVLGARPR